MLLNHERHVHEQLVYLCVWKGGVEVENDEEEEGKEEEEEEAEEEEEEPEEKLTEKK